MGLQEKGKGNPTPKAKEKLSNMETEEKDNPALLQKVNLVLPHTHSSHVGFATKLVCQESRKSTAQSLSVIGTGDAQRLVVLARSLRNQ